MAEEAQHIAGLLFLHLLHAARRWVRDYGEDRTMMRMISNGARFLGAGLALSLITAAAANAVDGNRILSRAAMVGGVRPYAVPASFDVHLHKPLGLHLRMDGSLYYKPPAQSALVITKRPPIIGGLFAKSYDLDLVPQTWPAKYAVRSV